MNTDLSPGAQFEGWLRNAELLDGQHVDVCIRNGVVLAVGPGIAPPGAESFDVQGCALSPALADHHIHLYAAAAAQASVDLSAAAIDSRAALRQAIATAEVDADGWLRAVAYHPSYAGELDRTTLDRWRGEVPVRVQHASGRRWTMNSVAIERLGESGPWQRDNGQLSGHLIDQDDWLSQAMQAQRGDPRRRPDLGVISRALASWGVIAVTDTGPSNDADTLDAFRAEVARGALRQRVQVMGNASLDAHYVHAAVGREAVAVGPHKIHLLESQLPDFEQLCAAIERSHEHHRPVAFHCVTRSELVFALAAFETTGVLCGDRIEHAGVCPDEQAATLARLGVWVVTQPEFVWRNGDRYLRDVDAQDREWLYRIAGLQRAGVALAASSDAPYGDLSPWRGMAAACRRMTRGGKLLGADERVDFDAALRLYSGPLAVPCQPAAMPSSGQSADLCVLDRNWSEIRRNPAPTRSRLTLSGARVVWSQD